MPYFVTGSNHRLWSAAVRDRLYIEPAEIPALLERLDALGVGQALWLATCDRTEIVGVAAAGSSELAAARALVAGRAGLAVADGQMFCLTGAEAVRHLFAVTASLESQIVGEPQVPGQVKAAWRRSLAAGLSGPELDGLMRAAFSAARRVRAETAISEGPTSIAAAAVGLARNLHGDLGRCRGLLVGLGDLGQLMVESLRAAGLGGLAVATPVDSWAEAAARRLDCHYVAFADLDAALAAADVVVTAVGLGRTILTPDMVAAAARRRRRRPVFIIDAALPTDVDPAVAELESAFVYDLADLERMALRGLVGREAAAAAAREIIGAAAVAFLAARSERGAVPAVVALRAHFEAARRAVLAEYPDDPAEATRRLVNRLLHRPSAELRRLAVAEDAAGSERLLRLLFGLEDEAPPSDNSDCEDPANEGVKT